MKIKSIISGLFLLGLTSSALAFEDFMVDPNYDGNDANAFTADKIVGGYTEEVVFTGANTFNYTLLWQAGQYWSNDGTVLVGNASPYNLYATFYGSGTYNTVGPNTTFTPDAGGVLTVYLDPIFGDTTFTAPGDGTSEWGITDGSGDDLTLAHGLSIIGDGLLTCSASLNCGSFGNTTSFSLTLDGKQFFIDPDPFYNISFQTGQFNGFPISVGPIFTLNGSLDVTFVKTVPEPSALSLLAAGLLGLGLMARRRRYTA